MVSLWRMRIPSPEKLQYHNLGTQRAEFGWLFDDKQFIFGVNQDGTTYIEVGKVDNLGNLKEETRKWDEFPYASDLTSNFLWHDHRKLEHYDFFLEGKKLTDLYEDCMMLLEAFKKGDE